VGEGTLGTPDRFRLPADEYEVAFDSTPPQVVPLTLRSEESLTLAIERTGHTVSHGERRSPADYFDCEAAPAAPDPTNPAEVD
jgi:hypothetical protein